MTPAQIKSKFRREGKTFTEWAAQHGYTRNQVYRVLNGTDKAHYGKAHDIAVKLGMKSAETMEA
ncbi:MAG: DNA-binding protein [Proteobacteria bacterium]|nr:DNA-binding protein [Pseudomonadota bacterium]